ncbi:MAG: ATP synthase subunit I [Syntrophobacteraceae bacterium]
MREIAPTETLVRRIEWVSGILLVLATSVAVVWISLQAAVGVLLGGAIAMASFQILKWQLRRAFLRPGKLPGKASLFASYYLRFLAVLFVIFVVIYYGWATPIPFLVGLSVMVSSIMLVGGFEFILMAVKKGES